MPKPVQAITFFLPLRYFMTIIRAIFLKGVGLEVLWREALALLVLGLAILGIAISRFRKKLG
jgi:ABC-2 type transport system permease protein